MSRGDDNNATAPTAESGAGSRQVLTIPNALSILRVICIPLFAWLVLGPQNDVLAFAILVVAGISDFLDGALARRWNQESRLGQLLDPAADRLTSLVVPIVLAVRDIVPWWFVVVLFARDVVVAVGALGLLRRQRVTLPVNYLGKAATFCLLFGLPLLLLGTVDGVVGTVSDIVGWTFTIWGTFLYWWSAFVYLGQMRTQTRALR